MKQVTVSGAIILRTNPETSKKEIFVTQRGYGDYKDGWEIPGGKLEPGESPEQCIEREIREELATELKERNSKLSNMDLPIVHQDFKTYSYSRLIEMQHSAVFNGFEYGWKA